MNPRIVHDAVDEGLLVRDDGGIVPSTDLVADFSGLEAASDEPNTDDESDGGLFDDVDLDSADTPAAAIIERQNEIIEAKQETIEQLESRMEALQDGMGWVPIDRRSTVSATFDAV